jgi:signal transduction histidine kinase
MSDNILHKPRILIVDDKPQNLHALETVLEDLNVEFVRALSGNEALSLSLKGDFALAIVDIQMPGMDGYEMVSLLRQGPKTRHIPVIFVSAIYSEDLHIVKGIETGAIDFISKPIIPEIIHGKVRLFLEMYHQKKNLETLVEELRETRDRLAAERDKAEAATRAKSLFLASMSHEIRTPLNGIVGIVDILKQTTDPVKLQEYLEIVEISADNLLNIINDILDFSKIESQQLEFEKIPFNLVNEVNNVVKLLKMKAESKNLDFGADFNGAIPPVMIGDPVRFKQILINLANNALKFTEKGFVKIIVETTVETDDSYKVSCTVADSGIGISEEGKLRLFKEFSQTEKSVSRRFGGTGLGLAISLKLTELMGGQIGVESEYGSGSRFWFYIKTGKPAAGVTQKGEAAMDIEHEIKKLNILLVEDNRINQQVAVFSLRKLGHETDVADNGQIALEKWASNEYDAILMDIQMPVMDGYEATRRIREAEKESGRNRIPIYAMTANAEKSERTFCLALGMDEYITKPFKPEKLALILQGKSYD